MRISSRGNNCDSLLSLIKLGILLHDGVRVTFEEGDGFRVCFSSVERGISSRDEGGECERLNVWSRRFQVSNITPTRSSLELKLI